MWGLSSAFGVIHEGHSPLLVVGLDGHVILSWPMNEVGGGGSGCFKGLPERKRFK